MTGNFPQYLLGIFAWSLGILLGLGLILRFGKRSPKKESPKDPIDELQFKEDKLISELRDLEAQASLMEPERYKIERQNLEQEAAETLKQLEKAIKNKELSLKTTKAAQPESSSFGMQQLKGVLLGVVGMGLVWLGVSFWSNSSKSPGVEIEPPIADEQAQTDSNSELDKLLVTLHQDPNNVEVLLAAGQILLRQNQVERAELLAERAAGLAPDNPDAVVQYAMLLAAKGNLPGAAERLDAFIAKHPDHAETWLLRGMLAAQSGDDAKKQLALKKYLELAPDGMGKEQAQALLNAHGRMSPMVAGDALALWKAQCSSCHGAKGAADSEMGNLWHLNDFTRKEWQARTTDQAILTAILEGATKSMGGEELRMTPAKGLTKKQQDELVLLIRSFGRP